MFICILSICNHYYYRIVKNGENANETKQKRKKVAIKKLKITQTLYTLARKASFMVYNHLVLTVLANPWMMIFVGMSPL